MNVAYKMLPPKYCEPMAATSFEPWEEPASQWTNDTDPKKAAISTLLR